MKANQPVILGSQAKIMPFVGREQRQIFLLLEERQEIIMCTDLLRLPIARERKDLWEKQARQGRKRHQQEGDEVEAESGGNGITQSPTLNVWQRCVLISRNKYTYYLTQFMKRCLAFNQKLWVRKISEINTHTHTHKTYF